MWEWYVHLARSSDQDNQEPVKQVIKSIDAQLRRTWAPAEGGSGVKEYRVMLSRAYTPAAELGGGFEERNSGIKEQDDM